MKPDYIIEGEVDPRTDRVIRMAQLDQTTYNEIKQRLAELRFWYYSLIMAVAFYFGYRGAEFLS
jgi:hypothetical protein